VPLRSPVRFAIIATLAVLAFSFLVKLPTLHHPIWSPDELIYLNLTEHWMKTGQYSLQGTRLLEQLPPRYYDHPAFHHPPGFCVLLTPFVYAFAHGKPLEPAVILSWLGQALVILSLALIGYETILRGAILTFRSRCLFLLPLVAATCDPIMNFIARRVWVDNLLAGACAMAFVCTWLAVKRSPGWAWAAGLFGALACSLKIAPLLFLPVLAAVAWRNKRLLLPILLPPLLVFALWSSWFHHLTGAWMPWWMKPDEALLQANAFVAASVHQPKLFYISQLLLCCPFALALLASMVVQRRIFQSALAGFSLLWIVIAVGTFTVIGWLGMPSETRYIAPALPALYWLFYARSADTVLEESMDRLFILFCFAVVAGAMLSSVYLYDPRPDEMLSPLHLFGAFAP